MLLSFYLRILLICFIILSNDAVGQGCCSGMAPIAANLGFPASNRGTFQVAATYDLNALNTLKEGSKGLDGNNRLRKTNALLTNIGYTFSKRISIDFMLVPYVKQIREVEGITATDITLAQGIGDVVMLTKYLLTKPNSEWNLQVGIGTKAPTGKADIKLDGLALNADLQPGTGSWDGIFWSGLNLPTKLRPSLALNASVNVKFTGSNKKYLQNHIYEFGDDYHLMAGFADQLVVKRLVMNPSLAFRYRIISPSKYDNQIIENTGGQWLSTVISIGLKPWNSTTINLIGEVPTYAKVEGIQLSSTYRLSLGVYVVINKMEPLGL